MKILAVRVEIIDQGIDGVGIHKGIAEYNSKEQDIYINYDEDSSLLFIALDKNNDVICFPRERILWMKPDDGDRYVGD